MFEEFFMIVARCEKGLICVALVAIDVAAARHGAG
jgi:hypothetical protein